MKNLGVKKAYSLAEIMTVMLVLSVIFAACAPFITKRRVSTRNTNAVWSSFNNSSDAFSASGNETNSAQLFFGLSPQNGEEVENSMYAPSAKLVIRSGPVTSSSAVQRQIQFRYGQKTANSKVTDEGIFAGTWLVDGKNTLLGGSFADIDLSTTGARQNSSIGYNALTSLTTGQSNVALGMNALKSLNTASYNVAIGYNAGGDNRSTNFNTFIGAESGMIEADENATNNTAIGYKALGGETSEKATGDNNTYIGYYAGANNTSGKNNVAVGSEALRRIKDGTYNIALGYNALSNLTSGNYNVAIGYNACSEVTSGSYKTCIGANSGPHSGTTGTPNRYNPYMNGRTDDVQRTYIGSKPSYYGGDAVLEIHNPKQDKEQDLSNNGMMHYLLGTPSNATTVINGNLYVNGRVYFTSGTSLYHLTNIESNFYGLDTNSSSGGAQCTKDDAKTYNFQGSNGCSAADPFSSYSTSSDRRLKNIGSKNNAGLAELSQLKIYNYIFKDDKTKSVRVGVLAQDLQKVFPNSVFQGDDGFLRIKWDEMFFATINAVKELDKKIVALVNNTVKLDSKISKLEKENALLKTQVDNLTVRVDKLKAQ
jgi:hypothetical protein